jgi:hypothetical protein
VGKEEHLRLSKSRRRRSQRGAELIEVTLMIIPILGFVFLTFDVSMVMFLRSTFQHAVREGCRFGVTSQLDGSSYADDSIRNIVKKEAFGFLSSPEAEGSIHVRFMDPVDGSRADNSQGNILQVAVDDYRYGPLTLFANLGFPVNIYARAYDLMEAAPPTGLPPIRIPE